MKTNHFRGLKKRHDRRRSWFLKIGLKNESNLERRAFDRKALYLCMAGIEVDLFAPSKMGNPWHWD